MKSVGYDKHMELLSKLRKEVEGVGTVHATGEAGAFCVEIGECELQFVFVEMGRTNVSILHTQTRAKAGHSFATHEGAMQWIAKQVSLELSERKRKAEEAKQQAAGVGEVTSCASQPPANPYDPVSHPKHYASHPSGIECIQVTEHMGFNLGNAMKYIWRCDMKHDAIEDLRKAVWYIEREITRRLRCDKPKDN